MNDYTRVTVVGSTRRAELVLPSGEAIGALIPDLMDLLDEAPGAVSRPLAIVRSTGEQLEHAGSLAEQRVLDGSILRLVREDAAPPPPEVSDVTDAITDAYEQARGRWSVRARQTVSAVAAGAFAAAAAIVAVPLSPAALPVIAGITVVAVLAAVVLARLGRRWAPVAAMAVAAGTTVPLAMVLPRLIPPTAAGTALPFVAEQVLVLAALLSTVLALGAGAGRGDRAAWWAGVIGAVQAAVPIAASRLGVEAVAAAGIGSILAVTVAGLLPWFAMSASGLTGLDDQVIEGRSRRRDVVLAAVDDAYRALSWSTWAVAAPIAVGAALLVLDGGVFAVLTGAAVLLVAALRTRTLPFTVQAAALWTAVVTAGIVAALAQPERFAVWALLGAAAASLVALVAGGGNPPAHRRAALRRWGNRLEALAVAALLPLLVGHLGLYAQLLGAFA